MNFYQQFKQLLPTDLSSADYASQYLGRMANYKQALACTKQYGEKTYQCTLNEIRHLEETENQKVIDYTLGSLRDCLPKRSDGTNLALILDCETEKTRQYFNETVEETIHFLESNLELNDHQFELEAAKFFETFQTKSLNRAKNSARRTAQHLGVNPHKDALGQHQTRLLTTRLNREVKASFETHFENTLSVVRDALGYQKPKEMSVEEALLFLGLDDSNTENEKTKNRTKPGKKRRNKQKSKNSAPVGMQTEPQKNTKHTAKPLATTTASHPAASPSLNKQSSLKTSYIFHQFECHHRVLRWKTKNVEAIREFIDFRHGQRCNLYKERSHQEIVSLRRQHHFPDLHKLFIDPEIRERYTFPVEDRCALGMLATLDHGSGKETESGMIILVGDTNKGLIYHCMFENIKESSRSYNEIQSSVKEQITLLEEAISEVAQEPTPMDEAWKLGQLQFNREADQSLNIEFSNETHRLRLHQLK